MTKPLPWQPDSHSSQEVVACLNFGGGIDLYMAGFREGAEVILEVIKERGDGQDLLVYPFVYGLHHAVELALKQVIRGARALLDGPTNSFPDGHNLWSLWTTASPLLQRIWADDETAFLEVRTTIEHLCRIDPEGESFRYPVTTKKKAAGNRRLRTLDQDLRNLDLQKVYDDVAIVLDLLDGADTGIDHYLGLKAESAQMNAEIHAEMRAEWEEETQLLDAEMRAEYYGEMGEP